MEFQDWMEEYIFHIILLQQYECSLYFTIGERRFYQQHNNKKKKKGIYEVKPPRKATQLVTHLLVITKSTYQFT